MDAERASVERAAMDATSPVMRDLRVALIRGFREARDPSAAVRAAQARLLTIVRDGMVVAHMSGRARSRVNASRARGNVKTFGPYDGALKFLRNRTGLKPADVERLRGVYGETAARVVAGAGDEIVTAVAAKMRSIAERGLHVNEGVAELRKALDSAGVSVSGSHVVETVYRTQTALAYSAGRVNANKDPAIQEILWGYEYLTVGDDRVRPNHAALEGFRAAKDDPVWSRIMPPNGYNCRCTVVEIFVDDDLASSSRYPTNTTVDGEQVRPGPDAGWEFNPGQVFDDMLRV